MNAKWQALILAVLILVSFGLTKIKTDKSERNGVEANGVVRSFPPSSGKAGADSGDSFLLASSFKIKKNPERNWNALDPKITAEAAIVQSLDENFPFFHFNTYKSWPMASLSKLMTAVLVLEEAGKNKKITITEKAVAAEGESGGLKSGEIYTSQDLLKIMLLASSNDAAAAFEDYFGGKDEFLKLLNKRAGYLEMTQTVFFDASGLSDLNQSTATDLLRLTKYILEKEPDIFNWSRLPNFLVQPINGEKSRTIVNIDPLVSNDDFWGGKTGTSEEARENLVAIFSLQNKRIAMILLGSRDRFKDAETLLTWVEKAYVLE